MPKIALLGGSAGALSAIEVFFESLPERCEREFAFIVIQHLSSDHKSRLDSLIAKWTSMQACFADDGMQIKAGRVYVGKPGSFLEVKEGRIYSVEPQPHSEYRHTIDFLCRSLASSFGHDVTLIVLSGMGNDGTEGAKLIKNANGRVLVQDPSIADFDDMPRCVIESGCVDDILPVEELGLALANEDAENRARQDTDKNAGKNNKIAFNRILELIRERAHNDMSNYKPTTLRRRIDRRMNLCHSDGYESYLQLLQDRPDELTQLSKDILIGVTAFLRDAEAFKIIEQEVTKRKSL